jgi:hypothetical protein
LAQNPAVVQKNVQTAVKASTPEQTATVSLKPSPTTARVTPVSTAKPIVVAAKPAVVAAKPSAIQAKPAVAAVQVEPAKTVAVPAVKTSATAVKPVAAALPVKAQTATPAGKPVAVVATPAKSGAKAAPVAAKTAPATVKVSAAPAKADPFKSGKAQPMAAVKVQSSKIPAKDDKAEEKKPATVVKSVGQAGRRDPFLSPVVNLGAVGSGCSSGKRCLAIDAISLRGIVKSDNGMIAVVVNATDKAYFLRENDPVFNGYVIKITGDSVVFKETFHDRLGKPLTRDITKTISRPVA